MFDALSTIWPRSCDEASAYWKLSLCRRDTKKTLVET